jgi:hypothetical protein
LVIVNSEDHHPWVETAGAKQKPDLFAILSWMYERRIPNRDRGLVPVDYRYGVMADWQLRDCVHALDCKLEYSNEALGELIIHMQHLNFAPHVPIRGMLFSRTGFWLIECQGNELLSRLQGKWIQPGSVNCIRQYFKPSVWNQSQELCQFLRVKVADPLHNRSDLLITAFLGAGGNGRVLKVVPQDVDLSICVAADLIALKVVKTDKKHILESELQSLKAHADSCMCNILARPRSGIVTTSGLCGFLLSPVGICSVTREMIRTKAPRLRKPFLFQIGDSLVQLHIHLNGAIIHGDARISNLIVSADESAHLFWVDLMQTRVADDSDSSASFEHDVKDLVTSLIHNAVQSLALNDAIQTYSLCPSCDAMNKVMEFVHTEHFV